MDPADLAKSPAPPPTTSEEPGGSRPGHAALPAGYGRAHSDPVQVAAEGVSGPSQPLPFQGILQRAFPGHDLSSVRLYTDVAARRATRALSAEAFAFGENIVAHGMLTLRQLAHELLHILANRVGEGTASGVSHPGSAHESEADEVAARVEKGEDAGPVLARYRPAPPAAPRAVSRILRYYMTPEKRLPLQEKDLDKFCSERGITDEKLKTRLRQMVQSEESYDWDLMEEAKRHPPLKTTEENGTPRLQADPEQRRGLIKSDKQGEERLDKWIAEPASLKEQDGTDKSTQLASRVQIDLRELSIKEEQDRKTLAASLAGVLLYLMHQSSHAPDPGMSKVQQLEKDHPITYARSQETHPYHDVLMAVLDVINADTKAAKLNKFDVLLPLNPEMQALVQETVAPNLKLIEGALFSTAPQGLDVRGRATVTREYEKVERPVDIAYDGAIAASMGMRQNNATSLTRMIDVVLQCKGLPGFAQLLPKLFAVTPTVTTKKPKKNQPEPVQPEELAGKAGSADELSKEISGLSKQQDNNPTLVPQLMEQNLNYRADIVSLIATSMPGLSQLAVVASPGNTNLTVQVMAPPFAADIYSTDTATHEKGWVNVILSFFAGLLNATAATKSCLVQVTRRQSFGFLRPTLTDTGPSVRLSLGLQPPEYAKVIVEALHRLDAAIASVDATALKGAIQVVEIKDFEEQKTPQPSQYFSLMAQFLNSDSNQMLAFRLAQQFAAGGDFTGFLKRLVELGTKKPEEEKSKKKQQPKTEQTNEQPAPRPLDLAIASNKDALFDGAKKPVQQQQPEEVKLNLAQFENACPIAATLNNVLIHAQFVLSKNANVAECAKLMALPETYLWVLTRIVNGVKKGQRLLARWKTVEATQFFSKASIVVEDLIEHTLLLGSLPRLDPGSKKSEGPVLEPAPKTNAVERQLESQLAATNPVKDHDVHVYRTDSGEQAGAAAVLATLKQYKKEPSELVPALEGKNAYFEFDNFFTGGQLRLRNDQQTKVGELVTLNPYFVSEEAKAKQPAPTSFPEKGPFTAFVDITNTDVESAEVKSLIKAWAAAYKTNKEVRLILFASLLKHEQLGTDKVQAGRIIIFGDDLPELKKLEESVRHPIVDDMLNTMNIIGHAPK